MEKRIKWRVGDCICFLFGLVDGIITSIATFTLLPTLSGKEDIKK